MSRSVSTAAEADLYQRSADKVWLILLKITHADLASDINVANNNEDVTSSVFGSSEVYQGFPFKVSLPSERDNAILGRAKISIDGTDRTVINAIRSITTPPTVKLAVVLSDTPDTAEIGAMTFTLHDINHTASSVSGSIGIPDILHSSFPKHTMNPNTTRGLFN